MQITALAGGVGGARFLRGLRDHLASTNPAGSASSEHRITIIGNTGDDISLFGLRICPDLDTLAYTLGGGIHEDQGWGRVDEGHLVQGELAAYGVEPQWFSLGDKDFGTHIARTHCLATGATLSETTARIAARWGLPQQGITLLPMTDTPVETHVVVEDPDAEGGERAIHFQEWWVRHHTQLPARRFVLAGQAGAQPAPGVLEAIRDADVILLPPSNPVVSIGVILTIPGIRDALSASAAPVVGVSPIVGGGPVRGYADACLAALDVPATPAAVAGLYADLLDGWLVAPGELENAAYTERVSVRERPLLMTDRAAAAELAGETLELALELRAARRSA